MMELAEAREKAVLRTAMRKMRSQLDPAWKAKADAAICDILLSRDDISQSESPVAIYMASPREIDISQFAKKLLELGRTVVAPRWNGETYEMARLKSLDPEDLRQGPMAVGHLDVRNVRGGDEAVALGQLLL